MSCLMINDIDAGLGRFGELLFDLTRKLELIQTEEEEKKNIYIYILWSLYVLSPSFSLFVLEL
jgi:hypothetical protein